MDHDLAPCAQLPACYREFNLDGPKGNLQVDRVRVIGGLGGVGVVTDFPGQKAFEEWFGASKVVNDAGQALVVHHGTHRDFLFFDRMAEIDNRRGLKLDTVGSWFTTSAVSAAKYGPKVMSVYLSIKKPLVFYGDENQGGISAFRAAVEMEGGVEAFREMAMSEGYDGISIVGDKVDRLDGDLFIAFLPEQIKSAFGDARIRAEAEPDAQSATSKHDQSAELDPEIEMDPHPASQKGHPAPR